ncbi:MAG: KGGVGR-motif variant AAA ATPase [Thermodesulfobacteriota bacterium]
MKHIPVRFDKALDIAVDKVKSVGAVLGPEIVLVRDLRGRIRVLAPGSSKALSLQRKTASADLGRELSESLGAYGFPSDRAVLFADDLMQGVELFVSGDRRLIAEESGFQIWLLDRQVTGQDWMRSPLKKETQTPRVTFFGIKGGVGRSTTLMIWAWRLAGLGKKILILDLDLESPGVSSTLLPFEFLPDYGIVDWFVEDGVGQAETVENLMIAASPLAGDLPGEIRIVPAFGRDTGDYLPKLARCYVDSNASGHLSWAERLQQMAHRMESKETPDLVVLDSRAGLHDIAAATVTRMGADTFLFAVDSMQTWNAYNLLFKHWRLHPQVREFRQKLQIVAGLVPETGREPYLKSFREKAWDLFRENLYDEAEAQEADVFSFDLDSMEAPHYPLPVFWNRALQEFDPLQSHSGIDKQITEAAMGRFMVEADRMVFPQEGNP